MIINSSTKPLLVTAMLLGSLILTSLAADTKPLRALYITGGCCHDYPQQKDIIPQGISARVNVQWTVIQAGGKGTKFNDIEHSHYQNPDWAKGYDIVVHNECFAGDADPTYIEKVLAPHRAGLPAMVLHCTMHTFRDYKPDTFREFLGVKTTHHGPQHPLDVIVVRAGHPIMKGFPADWKTGNEELYFIDQLFPNTLTLATAHDKKKGPDGAWVVQPKDHTLIWVNTYGRGRVFGTTLAHANKTFSDPVCLDLLSRGLLWACDKLDDDGKAKPGYSK